MEVNNIDDPRNKLAIWKPVKLVRAGKILDIGVSPDNSAILSVETAAGEAVNIPVNSDYMYTYTPEINGYLAITEHGSEMYLSESDMNEGYVLADEE